MNAKEYQEKVKIGHILIDDVGHVYEVIEKFSNSVATSPFPDTKFYGCEIITYRCMEEEGWKIKCMVVDSEDRN